MVDDQGNLEAPARPIEDQGAHDLETSDSDDHFSDAQSGHGPPGDTSPIPITRVEKVDHDPSHGEVPGTDAYNIREADAAPDQIAVIPESTSLDQQSVPTSNGSTSTLVPQGEDSTRHSDENAPAASRNRALSTPGDLPIPTTKVEKVDSEPSHGEVPGTEAYDMRKADAQPDAVEEVGDIAGTPTRGARSPSFLSHSRRISSGAGKKATVAAEKIQDEEDEEGFGDDFDDFEEGEEDAEFDDFADGFQEAEHVAPQAKPAVPSFPVLDFAHLDTAEAIQTAAEPFLDALFPPDSISTSILPSLPNEPIIFLTPRSASLWAQLVAPPPLQPPNWIRSRIRRLFLVSLGVPVDLDEILPASKQKKLILPSIHLSSDRTSSDTRSITRLKQGEGNASTTSLDSTDKPRSESGRRRKGPAPVPQFDIVSARQTCSMTEEALSGLTIEELKEHVQSLEALQSAATETLDYWTKRTDEKLGDREAFEGVIENLVKHARKVRK